MHKNTKQNNIQTKRTTWQKSPIKKVFQLNKFKLFSLVFIFFPHSHVRALPFMSIAFGEKWKFYIWLLIQLLFQ